MENEFSVQQSSGPWVGTQACVFITTVVAQCLLFTCHLSHWPGNSGSLNDYVDQVILEPELLDKEYGWGLGRSLKTSTQKNSLQRKQTQEYALVHIVCFIRCHLYKIQTNQMLRCLNTQKCEVFTDLVLVSSVSRLEIECVPAKSKN